MYFCLNSYIKILIIYQLSVVFFSIYTPVSAQDKTTIEDQINNSIKGLARDSIKFKSLETLFDKYASLDFNKAVTVGNKAIKFTKEKKDPKRLMHWYSKMAYLYMDYELFPLALDYIKLAMQENQKFDNEITWWLINIGNIYYAEEMYGEAENYYKNALNNFKKSTTRSDSVGIAVAYLNLALVNQKKKNKEKAVDYYKKSINACDDINDNYRKTNTYTYLVKMYLADNELDKADYYLEIAKECNKLSLENDLQHTIKEIEGDLYTQKEMYENSLKSYDLSIKLAISVNNTRDLIRLYNKKANVYFLLKKIDLAVNTYKASLAEANKINDIKRLVEINKLISELYFHQNLTDSAYYFLRDYSQWKDSLDNLNLKVLIHRYEKEREQSKIELLENDLAFEKKEQKIYKFSVIGILLLFFAVVIFLHYVIKSRRQLKKQNDKIVEQNNTISSQVEEIIQQNDLLSNYKNNLEKKVAEKTMHLEAAVKKAEESDLLKTAFLTNMSHEIRTPMNAILGFGSLLSNTDLDETNRVKYIEVLLKSSEQLHKVIDNIIEISKIESGQITVSKTYFDVNILFQELMLFFNRHIFDMNKSKIKLEFTNQLPAENSMIIADRNMIKQVFINLIDNAIKFTQEGVILYGCKLVNFSSIEFFVKDTGQGIEKHHFVAIFDRFMQVEDKGKDKNKGVGLGLPISKSLVDKLNGQLLVESEKGRGSRFFFTIPYETNESFSI